MSELVEPTSEIGGVANLSKSEIFDVLRNQRRRFVLHYLEHFDGEGPVELGELATQVAAWENDVPATAVTSTQRKRVYTTLQQSHLPKLDETGIVKFDSSRGTVRATDVVGDLTIYLEVVPGNEFAWHEFYLGLGAVGCALMAAVWAGIYPFSSVPAIAWGAVVCVVLVVSAAVQLYVQRGTDISEGVIPDEFDLGP